MVGHFGESIADIELKHGSDTPVYNRNIAEHFGENIADIELEHCSVTSVYNSIMFKLDVRNILPEMFHNDSIVHRCN